MWKQWQMVVIPENYQELKVVNLERMLFNGSFNDVCKIASEQSNKPGIDMVVIQTQTGNNISQYGFADGVFYRGGYKHIYDPAFKLKHLLWWDRHSMDVLYNRIENRVYNSQGAFIGY